MRSTVLAASLFLLASHAAAGQGSDTLAHDKTFLTRRDLAISAVALGATGLLSHWDTDIARASQGSRFQDSSLRRLSLKISKVNETTLTVAGLLTYGIARATGQKTLTDVALHGTEAVVLASLASQVIRGPLGRARPYVSHDSDQYDFKFGAGFRTLAVSAGTG